ncbi:tetratricopeptide (TPR) repeat protein [Saccharothrix coeruleofusca]|uniref:tetratricopeptide repeat protein n=1 Tax=Saccharothrix coeruleofusca TaxID=33919 RepID=UPI001AE50614|nr:tetratricopeptide repeat protein [Saccharothrix coeruleofusca]MBP2337669.1 tetratricopeptide (TPR) repeat protein [Saccharothrix coeruleofusca]
MFRLLAVTAIVGGVALLVTAVSSVSTSDTPQPVAAVAESALHRTISATQDKLRRTPSDAQAWAALGSAYVEQARVTGDPSYYEKAQGALDESVRHRPTDNGWAYLGLGALANARHDFAAARDFGQKATALLPDTAEAHGVLADALTQLGAAAEATAAVQRMLDLEPGVASFTRAAYDMEQRGEVTAAREALERALGVASAPAEVVFCRYHLGELAFDNGQLDLAARHYEEGLRLDPRDATLLQGTAKVAAARGERDRALDTYAELVARTPLPQYLHEHANLLRAAGRHEEAARQFDVLAQQFRLVPDDLAASVVAADRGDAAQALRLAEAEWGRRQHPLVADALAWALHLNGRDAEALGFAERAASSGWRNAVFAFHRGVVLAALGRRDEAAGALEEALRINPHFSPVDAPVATATLAGLR